MKVTDEQMERLRNGEAVPLTPGQATQLLRPIRFGGMIYPGQRAALKAVGRRILLGRRGRPMDLAWRSLAAIVIVIWIFGGAGS